MARVHSLNEWLLKLAHHQHKARLYSERAAWHTERAREASEKLHVFADKLREPQPKENTK